MEAHQVRQRSILVGVIAETETGRRLMRQSKRAPAFGYAMIETLKRLIAQSATRPRDPWMATTARWPSSLQRRVTCCGMIGANPHDLHGD
jgi:hypothetical protein